MMCPRLQESLVLGSRAGRRWHASGEKVPDTGQRVHPPTPPGEAGTHVFRVFSRAESGHEAYLCRVGTRQENYATLA